MPDAQRSLKLLHTSPIRRALCKKVVDHHRLEHVEFKMAIGAADVDRHVVAEHLGCDHRHGFALCRIDLARHDRTARLIVWNVNFSDAGTRSRAEHADVIGDFHEAHGHRFEGAMRFDDAVVRCECLKFVGAVMKGKPVNSAIFCATKGA
jgi:hypothetical protein